MSDTQAAQVDQIIRARQTKKVFADPDRPPSIADDFIEHVMQAVEIAGWAPFHYPAHASHRTGQTDSLVPWRFVVLDARQCRSLVDVIYELSERNADDKLWADAPRGKIPRMLAAAGALVQATWLPEPIEASAGPAEQAEREKRNAEHHAAAAAAVQNLLLAATARGIETYWSSGGVLATAPIFARLEIPDREAFLGSIFLFPQTTDDDEFVTGKLRDRRGPVESWARRLA